MLHTDRELGGKEELYILTSVFGCLRRLGALGFLPEAFTFTSSVTTAVKLLY